MLNGKLYKNCIYVMRTVDTNKITNFVPAFKTEYGYIYYKKEKN
jgi:hypothetical protein